MTLFWAILFAVLIVVELCTLQLVSIWLAVGSLLAMIASICDLSVLAQFAIFVLSSAVLFAVTLPFIKKYANSNQTATNSELNIGKHAIVIEEINAVNGTGRVTLDGVDWSAVSDLIIPKGTTVIVKEIIGTKLNVSLENQSQKTTI
ncbi:MAG: NfeD family protein [Ruminococcus sp.]|nr:NfeD family protein [Ruminococcus sp.]